MGAEGDDQSEESPPSSSLGRASGGGKPPSDPSPSGAHTGAEANGENGIENVDMALATVRQHASIATINAPPPPRSSLHAASVDAPRSPPPSPGKKRVFIAEPPRWRFVNSAKKSMGYSSFSAGTYVQGKSAKELVAKYRPPEPRKGRESPTLRKLLGDDEQEDETEPSAHESPSNSGDPKLEIATTENESTIDNIKSIINARAETPNVGKEEEMETVEPHTNEANIDETLIMKLGGFLIGGNFNEEAEGENVKENEVGSETNASTNSAIRTVKEITTDMESPPKKVESEKEFPPVKRLTINENHDKYDEIYEANFRVSRKMAKDGGVQDGTEGESSEAPLEYSPELKEKVAEDLTMMNRQSTGMHASSEVEIGDSPAEPQVAIVQSIFSSSSSDQELDRVEMQTLEEPVVTGDVRTPKTTEEEEKSLPEEETKPPTKKRRKFLLILVLMIVILSIVLGVAMGSNGLEDEKSGDGSNRATSDGDIASNEVNGTDTAKDPNLSPPIKDPNSPANVPNNPTISPSAMYSHSPSSPPSLSCPTNSKLFAIEYTQNNTNMTQQLPEQFWTNNSMTWLLRDACTQEEIVKCLPCENAETTSSQPSSQPSIQSSSQPSSQSSSQPSLRGTSTTSMMITTKSTYITTTTNPESSTSDTSTVNTNSTTTTTAPAYTERAPSTFATFNATYTSTSASAATASSSSISSRSLKEEDGSVDALVDDYVINNDGVSACLPNGIEYVFEVVSSNVAGDCCGFAPNSFVVSYDHIVLNHADRDDRSINIFSTNVGSDTEDKSVEKETSYFGQRAEPCPTLNPSVMPSSVPSVSPTDPPTRSPSEIPPIRDVVFPENNSLVPCREVIESEMAGRINGLQAAFCGFCEWKNSGFFCFQRVTHLVRVYAMTQVSARQGLLDQGHCSVPSEITDGLLS